LDSFWDSDYNAKLFLLAMVLWRLWLSRNKRATEGKFPRSPIELLFNCNGFLKKWKRLMRADEQAKIEEWGGQVKWWTESFQVKCRRRPSDDFFL